MGKRASRSASLSYPKKDWRTGLYNCTLLPSQIIFCSWCYTKRRIGRPLPANHSFGMITTKILRSVFPRRNSYVNICEIFMELVYIFKYILYALDAIFMIFIVNTEYIYAILIKSLYIQKKNVFTNFIFTCKFIRGLFH